MTSLHDPTTAEVFTVGKNQRNGFDVAAVGSHDHFLDAMFNRGSETCRGLYDRIVGMPSPTRRNTDTLVSLLSDRGVEKVLETNVICYSTPMSSDLRLSKHLHGTERGTEIFKLLLECIKPRILISQGADTARKLGKFLGKVLPEPPSRPGVPAYAETAGMVVFVVPSLAPPAFNKWSSWSREHLATVSDRAAQILKG